MRLGRTLRLLLVALAGGDRRECRFCRERRRCALGVPDGVGRGRVRSRWSGDFAGDQADDILWYARRRRRSTCSGSPTPGRAGRIRSPGCGSRSTAPTDRSSATSSATTTTTSSGTGPAPRPTRCGRRSPTDAVFERIDRLTVDGDYRPEVLRDYRDGAHKDRIVWQRTSKGHDVVWSLRRRRPRRPPLRDGWRSAPTWRCGPATGTATTRRPAAVRAGHGGGRSVAERDRGGFTEHDLDDQRRVPAGDRHRRRAGRRVPLRAGRGGRPVPAQRGLVVHLRAGRLVPDRAAWPTAPTPAGSRSCTAPRPAPARTGSSSRPAGGRRFKLSESHDIGAGIRPVTGDFDDDGVVDILWYGAGVAPRRALVRAALDVAPITPSDVRVRPLTTVTVWPAGVIGVRSRAVRPRR